MFLLAHFGNVPLLGVPACALHLTITILNLILPRILAGEKIEKWKTYDIATEPYCIYP